MLGLVSVAVFVGEIFGKQPSCRTPILRGCPVDCLFKEPEPFFGCDLEVFMELRILPTPTRDGVFVDPDHCSRPMVSDPRGYELDDARVHLRRVLSGPTSGEFVHGLLESAGVSLLSFGKWSVMKSTRMPSTMNRCSLVSTFVLTQPRARSSICSWV